MKVNFSSYLQYWGLKQPDTNIDHRCVANLETYFKRHKMEQLITLNATDYQAEDIVFWRLNNGLPHIGIVSGNYNREGRPLIIHNNGVGVKAEDILFLWKINGHFRYFSQ